MNSNIDLPAEQILTPRKADLMAFRTVSSEDIPCLNSSRPPQIIFSAPQLHDSQTEDSVTNDSEPEKDERKEESGKLNVFSPKLPLLVRNNLLPIKTRRTPRLTLVLDLDETLVHSELRPIPNPDAVLKVTFNGENCNIYVLYRPGMFEFLHSLCKNFELVVFTASHEVYATQLLNHIDPYRKLIKYRFHRNHCYEVKGKLIKDLRIFGRNLSETIIVDNTVSAFSFQLDNGIPISS